MMNPNEPNYGQISSEPQPAQSATPTPQTFPITPQAPSQRATANPYDFIINPAVQPKKAPLAGARKPVRLLIGVGGIAAVLILAAVVFVSFFAKGESPQSLTSIVQQQQEIIRIATQGEQQAASETTKNLAYNVDLSITTNQRQIIAYATKRGVKITEKELVLKKDSSTDSLLENAKATSTYESALQKVLASQLQTYLTDLQKTYDSTKSDELKNLIATSYKSGKVLLDQANIPTPTNNPAQ